MHPGNAASGAGRGTDKPDTMGDDEIRFEDLLDDEPAAVAPPASFRELLEHGISRQGGLRELEALAAMDDADPRFAAVRSKLQQLLCVQAQARIV
jgi:hypothetical protein